jgi:hypothetical protein
VTALYITLGVVAVVIALGIFAMTQIRGLSVRSGKAEAQVEMSDEAFKAQTRRQKVARRVRARGRVLIERMQAWSGTGRS